MRWTKVARYALSSSKRICLNFGDNILYICRDAIRDYVMILAASRSIRKRNSFPTSLDL